MVVAERYGHVFSPCASIRLHAFLERFRRSDGATVHYVLPSELERCQADVVLWHRVSLPTAQAIARLNRAPGLSRALKVYDLDDNLLDMEGHGEAEVYDAWKQGVRRSLRTADLVWCSTPQLAARVSSQASSRVIVAPNALDPVLWQTDTVADVQWERSGPLRLLYVGTRTHDADLDFLLDVLSKYEVAKPGRVSLTLVGVTSREQGELPAWCDVAMPDWDFGASYPAFVNWLLTMRGRFDLGVAPLVDSAFNDCKSAIKVLDYAALSLPTLASAVPAYTHALRDGVDSFLAPNSRAAWESRLSSLDGDRRRLAEVSANAARLVSANAFEEALRLRKDSLMQELQVRESRS